jgi:isocitrate dehydrogenase (NAD+)
VSTTRATLIPGDGIGPEITAATLQVLVAAGVRIEWEECHAGVTALEREGDVLPQETLASIERNRLALKGPLTTPVGSGFRSVNVALRRHFDLYANVRPAETLVPGRWVDGVDLLIVRENTEGLYIGEERWIASGGDAQAAAESVMRVSRSGSERIIRRAFELAIATGRTEVTLAHKANILKYTMGLMLEVGRRVAAEYEGRITYREVIIDALCMQLVMRPQSFQVLVMENLFGDIVSDLAAGLVGGLGMAPGANIGTDCAVFEAVHGSAPDIAGMGVANPTAMLLSACMLLRHIDQAEPAERIENALKSALAAGDCTGDLGGSLSTSEYARAVIARI